MATPKLPQQTVSLPLGGAQGIQRTRKRTSIHGSRVTPYLFMAPYLLLFGVFVALPAVFGFWVSLHEYDYLLPQKPWVGLDNYATLLDPNSITSEDFWHSMGVTAQYTLYSAPFKVILPLLVALLLNERFRGRSLFRAIYFAPYVLGISVVGILARFILDPNLGLLNNYLGRIGLPDHTPWTTDLPWAWASLVGASVWWTLGFNSVIYLAGLQGIPRDLYEAVAVDGGTRWDRFRDVTLPGLRPVLLFVVTITILAAANMFGQSYLITHGGPGTDTRTVVMYIAEEGLRNFRMGSAAAMSYVLAAFLALISVLNFVFLRDKED